MKHLALTLSLTLAASAARAQQPPPPPPPPAPAMVPPPVDVAPAPQATVPQAGIVVATPAPQQQQALPPPPPPPGAAPWMPPPGAMQAAPMYGPPTIGYVPYGYGYAAVAPPMVPYEGGPVPPGARVIQRTRGGLIGGGAGLFGATYFTSLILGLAAADSRSSDSRGLGWLAVPVIGPLIAGGVADVEGSGAWGLLVLDTLAQTAGLTMFIWGITHPAPYLVYDGAPRAARPRTQWAVAPTSTGHGPGASFSMTF